MITADSAVTLSRASGSVRTYRDVRRLGHMRSSIGDCFTATAASGKDVTLVRVAGRLTDTWCAVYNMSGRSIYSGKLVAGHLPQ